MGKQVKIEIFPSFLLLQSTELGKACSTYYEGRLAEDSQDSLEKLTLVWGRSLRDGSSAVGAPRRAPVLLAAFALVLSKQFQVVDFPKIAVMSSDLFFLPPFPSNIPVLTNTFSLIFFVFQVP